MFKFKNYGCTRLVFLIGGYAIKIPNFTYSQLHFLNGCYANASERQYSANFPKSEKVTPTIWCAWLGLISIQYRCLPLERDLTENEVDYFKDICPTDTKKENFGYLNGRLVCLDYP